MRKLHVYVFVGLVTILLIVAQACVRNSIDIEVVEDGCKWLNIRNDVYDLIEDPCQSGRFSVFSKCGHNEDTSCIHLLKINPVFYNEFNQPIPLAGIDKVYQGKEFFLSESEISFEYDFTIYNQSTPQTKVNYAVVTYSIQSEFEDESNSLSRRFHFPCTVINEDDYTFIQQDTVLTVDRTPGTFPVDFWDNAGEDGDLITAYLNGNLIVNELLLFNAKKRFDVPKSWLRPGSNDLVVFALNQGSSGPNTVSLAVNNIEVDLGAFAAGLKTGNAVKIDF